MAITKIGTPELFDFSATNTALQLPTGTTAQRPTSPSAGEWRFNTDEKYVEYWDGSAWFRIDTEALPNPDEFPSQNFNVNTYTGNGGTQTLDAKFNEAANFNGSSTQIEASGLTGTVLPTNGNWSVGFWMKPQATTTSAVVSLMTSSGTGWAVFTEANVVQVALNGSTPAASTGGFTTAALNTWMHVTLTFNSSTTVTSIYYNGGSSGADATINSGPSAATSATLKMGYSVWNYFQGQIDQVRLFNTTLSDAQVTDLYTNETTTTAATLNFPAGAGCIAAYQLDGDASDISGTYGGVETNIGYTGLKFQADFIWIKSRNAPADHTLTDSVRGVQELLSSNTTAAEGNQSPNGMTNFGANSFSVTDNSGGGSGVNGAAGGANSGTPPGYVAWCWKAAASTTTIPSGTNGSNVISNVRANTASGFSIVKFGALGAANSIVSHGLSSAPEFIIYKNLDTADNWYVYTSVTGLGKYLNLNTSGAVVTNASNGFTSVNANTFTVNLTTNADDTVAYCFHSVAGYQRISSYTGTGNNPGPIVYTTNDGTATGTDGFEPAMIIIKRTDSAEDWKIIDNKRGFVNSLEPNEGIAEEANNNSGFIAATNGFQINDTSGDYNANGGTYIYLAIAADKDTSVPTQANSFSPTLYTGNDSTNNIYTPFAPDFTWIKARTDARSHTLIDTIRGATRIIQSESTGAEWDGSSYIDSFNPNGFTVKSNAAFINNSSQNYISWNWKAGGLPTINNDGTITSIVTANTAAGFSIARYTATSATSESIGHGLTSLTPSLIFYKKTSNTEGWIVWYPESSNNQNWLELNDQRQGNFDNAGWGGSPDSTVVHLQDNNSGRSSANGETYIAYIFADIAGYQRIGNYQGSGNAGKQVYVTDDGLSTGSGGFQPSYVLIKCTSDGGTDWLIFTSNVVDGNGDPTMIRANTAETQFTGNRLQFTSDGFTLEDADGSRNGLGRTYYYLAIK
jgi:hypothetical protein